MLFRLPIAHLIIGALACLWPGHRADAQALSVALGEQVLTVPSSGLSEPELEVTLFKPEGAGPFPVMLINHGKETGNPRFQPRYRPTTAARPFVQRGYAVVVPMRQGFSKSGGQYIGGGCNVGSNGMQQADSVHRTLAWLAAQPWADVSRNVVMGQSHGGLTTMAYGTQPHPGTRLLVNFAGGLRQDNCTAWQHDLVRGLGDYGRDSRLPSLWFYGDNDSYFQPWLFKAAHERYVQAGGRAELVAYGEFGSDSHMMFGSRAGLPIWLPKVLAAMDKAGLPTAVIPGLGLQQEDIAPPASGFAAIDDIDRVPVKSDRAREGYKAWLAAQGPKAFAIHPVTGHWASAWNHERPLAQALEHCARLAKSACRLYAVDGSVVWSAE